MTAAGRIHPPADIRPGTLEIVTVPSPEPDRWLTDYLARHLAAAGVVEAEALAGTMSADISAAFTTLARVDQAGVVLDS